MTFKNICTMCKCVPPYLNNTESVLDPTIIPKFVTPLFTAQPMPKEDNDYYHIKAKCIYQQILPSGFDQTKIFAYGSDLTNNYHFPSATIEAKYQNSLYVNWENSLVDENNNLILFDAISAFDVLEHIYENELEQLAVNVRDMLTDDGIFITSIATFEDEGYHVTLKPKDWWLAKFSLYGLVEDEGLEVYGRTSSFEIVWKKA